MLKKITHWSATSVRLMTRTVQLLRHYAHNCPIITSAMTCAIVQLMLKSGLLMTYQFREFWYIRKWFEPRSNIPWLKKIIWVIGVLRRTVVSDWHFDNLCGSHLQSQVVLLVSWQFKNPDYITHLPTATLSTEKSNRSPGFSNFQLTNTTT